MGVAYKVGTQASQEGYKVGGQDVPEPSKTQFKSCAYGKRLR